MAGTIRWEELERKLETTKALKDKLEEKGWHGKKARRKFVEWVIKNLKKDPNLWNLENKAIPKLTEKEDDRVEPLKVVVEVIKQEEDFYGLRYSPEEKGEEEKTEEEKIIELEREEEIEGVIGRVAITRETPAEPFSFSFWLKPDKEIYVEPGELVEVSINDKKRQYAIGIVEDAKTTSEKKNIFEHYAGWGLGRAGIESPTEFPIIKHARALLIYRNDGKSSPFTTAHPVYKSKARALEEALSKMIRNEEDRILSGFVRDGTGKLVPVYGSFTNIFGYKSGHVNITGKSGLAGKTSYALFLIASALSYSERMHEKSNFSRTLGIIAFNVKERDLLDVVDIPYANMEEALKNLEDEDPLTAELWSTAYIYGINPIKVFGRAKIYKPGNDFSYGLQDLIEMGEHTITALFDPSDVNEQMEALISDICEEYGDGKTSFEDLIRELGNRLSGATGNFIPISDTSASYHHTATISKFLSRIGKILRSPIIERARPRGNPLDVTELDLSDLWIVDIEPLRDNEQRMVFFSVLSKLQSILMKKKRGEQVTEDGRSLSSFPSRVSIFVDELNKFAPSGRISSSIKQFIKDIAARGRSIGLTLIGAQQFASQIDEEILGNCSTFLIGRSEELETSGRFYRRIPDGLRKRIGYLRQGELVFLHDPLQFPFVINFPKPLHRVMEE